MSKGTDVMCTVERADLVRAAGLVAGVIDSRNTIPVLANMLLVASGGRMTLTATNLNQWMQVTIPAKGELAATTVSGARLRMVAGNFDDGAQIGLTMDDGRLVMRAGRSRFQLPVLPRDDFPMVKDGELRASFTIKGDDLAAALGRCAYAMSNEEVRFYLNGIFMHQRADGEIRLAATNGHCLAALTVTLDGLADWPDLILPARVVNLLVRDLKGVDDDVAVEAIDGDRVLFRWGDHELTTKEIDGTFPDYTRVIPSAYDKVLTVDPARFGVAVKRVAAVAGDKTRAIRIDLSADSARVSCISPENGMGEEEVSVAWDAGSLEIGMNAQYLGQTMDAVSRDSLIIKFADALAPVLFEPVTGGDFRAVVMPIRI